jgi:DNA-binding winged helix-turn-helix (wHTH) protein/TolB-like protein
MNRPSELRTVFVAVDLAREPDFALGQLTVRPSLRRIVRDGREEAVQPRVMQVLVALARAKEAVVSREELVETCWDGIVVGDDSITHSIAKVRQLADCNGAQAFEIETIARVGYRLVPSVADDKSAKTSIASVTQLQATVLPETAARRLVPLRKIALPAVAALTVVAVVAALLVNLLGAHRNPPRPSAPQPALMAAVLPFTPLYADKDAQTYADKISSDVADMLGRTDLNVIAPALSFQFRSDDAKARAAHALHANILVDGNVTRAGESFRVTARVEDVASGLILLSKDIERPVSEAEDLPDQVATFIAGALGSDISLKALAGGSNPRTRASILRAFYQCPHRQDPLCMYEIARNLVRTGPNNAMAQTMLAIETTNALYLLPEREKPTAIAAARNAAWTAIRLDPHSGDPYIALGVLAADGATTEAYLRKGLSVDPDSTSLAGYLSGLLLSYGRSREAFAVIQKIAARYSFLQFVPATQIAVLLQLGHADDALEIAKRGQELWPERGLFRLLHFEATAFEGDPVAGEALLKASPTEPLPPRAFADIARAMRTRSVQDTAVVSRDCKNLDASAWPRVRVCLLALTMLGRIDEVFRLRLDDSSQDLLFWPQTAAIRADLRFFGLTQKLHLMSYWKATHSRPDYCDTERVPVCAALTARHA